MVTFDPFPGSANRNALIGEVLQGPCKQCPVETDRKGTGAMNCTVIRGLREGGIDPALTNEHPCAAMLFCKACGNYVATGPCLAVKAFEVFTADKTPPFKRAKAGAELRAAPAHCPGGFNGLI